MGNALNGVRVRSATLSDVESIFEMRLMLQRHLVRSNPSIWRKTDVGKTQIKETLEQEIPHKDHQVLLAEVHGVIVGFAHGIVQHRTEYIPNDVGTIGTLYVKEGFRRRGIGRILIQELCRFFRSKKAHDVYVRYVLGNEEGERFWNTLGFTPILTTANATLELLDSQVKSR